MEKLKGSISVSSLLPTEDIGKTKKTHTLAIPEIKSQSLITLLPSMKKENGSQLVDYNQELALTSLKFQTTGEPVLTLEDRPFVYEVVGLLNQLDYEIVYNFLSANWDKIFGTVPDIRKKIILDNPLLQGARDRLAMDMEVFRGKTDVAKGVLCKRCGSEETISVERQIRKSDEPVSIFCYCQACSYKWQAQ